MCVCVCVFVCVCGHIESHECLKLEVADKIKAVLDIEEWVILPIDMFLQAYSVTTQ